MGDSDVGLYGLAVMGQNFALNMASKGFKVSVCNRSPSKVDDTVTRAKAEGDLPLVGHKDPKEFVASIKKPRKIIILVQAGAPVDSTIALLKESGMEEGDIIVDGGNEWYPNSIRRAQELESSGIEFVGMGISGGEEGARNGPSLMPGGSEKAYKALEPILTKAAAQVDDGPCVFHVGPIGAGNYVKMVHNGIEYGDMQLIAETYDVLKTAAGLTNEELATTFAQWNETELKSFLIEITAKIFTKKDDLTGDGYVVDKVLDKTGMKGTGRWTIQEAAERNVAAPTMAAALDARYISGRKDERVAAAKVLQGPSSAPKVDKNALVEDVRRALFLSKITSYAQGMNLIKAASEHHNWNINLSECARIWKGGCIIRAEFLDDIKKAYSRDPQLANLLVDPYFADYLNREQSAWRRIASLCIASGIPAAAMTASISYFDSYRRERLSANLVQAQRDFFGGHTYERVDKEGTFHCLWDDTHFDLGDLASRRAGEL